MDARDAAVNLAVAGAAVLATFLLLEAGTRVLLGSNIDYRYHGGSWSPAPNQTGFTAPRTGKTASINRYGVRGTDTVDGGPAVVMLGDSFTFGYCLGDTETLPHQLEQELQQRYSCDVDVINGGVPGYGVWQMIDRYNRTLRQLPHQAVVLTVIKPDIVRQPPDSNPYAGRKRVVRRLLRSSSFLSYMKPRLEVFRQLVTGRQQLYDDRFDRYLQQDQQRIARFHRRLSRRNKTLILHVWVNKQHQNRFYRTMQQFAEQQGIPMLANHYPAAVQQYPGPRSDLYCPDGHPSPVQTRRIADHVAPQLTRLAGVCTGSPG